MEKILTVSIAAYNVGKYIEETLDSLVIPEILDDIEVFVVDDGGTDNSLSIAKKYEKKYPETFHVIHKENGGYGSVFNYTVKKATGKYFKLLDGDDWFSKTGLIQLVNQLNNTDADIVVTNYFKGPNNNNLSLVTVVNKVDNGFYDSLDGLTNRPIGMWAITYKTEILRSSKLFLPEHTLYTDQYYDLIPLASCNKIELSSVPVYCYRVGRDGQSVSKDSRIKHCDEMLYICKEVSEFAEANKDKRNGKYVLMRAANYHTTAIRTIMLDKISKKNLDKIKTYDAEIRMVAPSVYNMVPKMGKIGKLIYLYRKTNYQTYWLLGLKPGGVKNWE